jgi:hypothetical protein
MANALFNEGFYMLEEFVCTAIPSPNFRPAGVLDKSEGIKSEVPPSAPSPGDPEDGAPGTGSPETPKRPA